MAALLIIVGVVELWYWLVYFPRAWKNPGMNDGVDDIRYFVKGE